MFGLVKKIFYRRIRRWGVSVTGALLFDIVTRRGLKTGSSSLYRLNDVSSKKGFFNFGEKEVS